MSDMILHTPDGVRDIYNGECEKKLILEDRLFNVIRRYGYSPIETPSFEFFDVFGKEIGTTPSKDLYKFFDRDGNTLVLRPDITPSVARSYAKYFMDEKEPVRLCYKGNTFTNHSDFQGNLKETTQLGAELIADDSVAADAEVIALTVDCFKSAGLTDFQISVGNTAFFRAICQEASIDEEHENLIRDYICSKNFFVACEVLKGLGASDRILKVFDELPYLTGQQDMLERALPVVEGNPDAVEAINRLKRLYELLESYGCGAYVSFDLGLLSKFDYYTGIIFDGYTLGSGQAVAKGGRYDSLISFFGKDAPAVGCVVMLDQLQAALRRQKIEIAVEEEPRIINYVEGEEETAIREAVNLRSQGKKVKLIKSR
ncbi:MAG: ATP phosphoribosyltransferase regulatory subunit [Eubacterium sp.]|nr:ATP phosphoribosyltransferase regulatory subunit [Eubacterium sp.]